MTICFFGIYKDRYSRNRILKKGFEENGIKVVTCRTDLKGAKKFIDLIKKHWRIRKKYDVMFVGYLGWSSVVLVKLLTRKPIVFDAFLSIYDSTVFDKKKMDKKSLRAKYYWFMDWVACTLADKILLDTNEHIKYFVQEFGIKKEKFERVFVGTETDLFKPDEKVGDEVVVHYHGNTFNLQGAKYIMEAARMFKDIKFNMVGTRVKKRFEKDNIKNVNFIANVPYEELSQEINKADICLGIFGDTNKTQRVIPNKVYECAACKKPIITADTPAIRELFNENDLMLIPTANSEEIAKAINKLKNDKMLREKLAANAYYKVVKYCNPKKLTIAEIMKIKNN